MKRPHCLLPPLLAPSDNADATSLEFFQSHERSAFNGLALVVIRSHASQPGAITLHAASDGLATATISLTAR